MLPIEAVASEIVIKRGSRYTGFFRFVTVASVRIGNFMMARRFSSQAKKY